MTSPDPSADERRRDSVLAVSIMFFSFTLLCTLLGWAAVVRHNTKILHVPETGSWLVAAAMLATLGLLFLLWSRRMKR